ncbi:MAG: shikimate dehydrogenase [Verrucomicrobiales bacterium]|nr:shikimate dehydrogenase [Verrucomicrobiales bacterium]
MSDPFAQPINARTRYCAVVGHPIKHSASPAMQNAGIAALGLNWRYLAFDVHPNDLRATLTGARAMKFIGLNLTVPHKVLALDMMDALDDSARTWGAVNTVRFEARDAQGRWRPLIEFDDEVPDELRAVGFNTDADGFARAVREDLGLEVKGASAFVLGTGGAGQVAALRLATDGAARLWLVDVAVSKAEAVATEICKRSPQTRVTVGFPDGPVDLLVQATPLGLKPGDPFPLDESKFPLRRAGAVYDMIYRPAETPLLAAAKAAGCRTANGIGMLLYQGVRALEIWTGRPGPVAQMRRALEAEVYGH